MMSDQAKRSFKEPTRILGGVPHVINLPDLSEAMSSNLVKTQVFLFERLKIVLSFVSIQQKAVKIKDEQTNDLLSSG